VTTLWKLFCLLRHKQYCSECVAVWQLLHWWWPTAVGYVRSSTVGLGYVVYRNLYTLIGGQRAEKFENHCYRQCGKISQPQGAHTRCLIGFSFEKLLSQIATLTAIVRKIRSIITIFGTEFPRLYFWINCKSSKGPSFSTVNFTSETSYNHDATITFFIIMLQTK